MSQHGKKYTDSLKQVDRETAVSIPVAVDQVKNLATAKFDETVELAVRLGVDPRKAEQIVRGTLSLPAGIGKDVRVAVVAAGDQATQAREAGADHVGADDREPHEPHVLEPHGRGKRLCRRPRAPTRRVVVHAGGSAAHPDG